MQRCICTISEEKNDSRIFFWWRGYDLVGAKARGEIFWHWFNIIYYNMCQCLGG